MIKLHCIGILGLMCSAVWAAGRGPQVPQAIVLAAGGSEVVTELAESPIPVMPGMALYENDRVRSGTEPVAIWMCGSGEIDELLPGKSLRIGASGPIADAGALRMKERSAPCQLPALERGQLSAYPAQTRSRGASQGNGERAPSELSFEAREAIAVVRARVEQDPKNLSARVALAESLSRLGRVDDALAEYELLGDEFPGAVWTRGVITRLQREQLASSSGNASETYALLIGISQYVSPTVPSLMFADRDAETFAEFLQTPRGGGLPKEHILLLTNEKATRDAIDDALSTFLEKAGAANTLILFVAAHGVSVPAEQDPQTRRVMLKEPYILTTESNPEETKTSGYPMAAFGELIAQEGQRFGKVLVYVDVCRAGNIKGLTGAPRELEPQVQDAFNRGKGGVGVLLATDARHDAFESELIGNGHGAFTYSVLDALNGAAVPSGEDRIEFYDLRHYVEEHVRLLTGGNQTPVYIETDPNMLISENLKDKPGIQLPPAQKIPTQHARQRGQAGRAAAPVAAAEPPGAVDSTDDAAQFEESMAANRLLPEENGAVQVMERLQRDGNQTEAANLDRARRLRVALEDHGQAVLLRYLRGDQNPQSRTDFDRGARYFEEALRLAPGTVFDESRLYFCRGRALIFAKQYESAKQWLGRSILLDPLRAYAYNALGIAYLEEIPSDPNNYMRAMAAFRDAIRYAPLWAYPFHNLALTQMQHGDYDVALGTYREAMRLAPEASYLPYNMGLVYQKINRTKDAYESYRTALRTVEAASTPREVREPRSMIYNALGSLEATGSRGKQAERYFRLAIADSPASMNAKHNLALLLSRKTASPEAEALWNECLTADPAYLPARLSLAEYLAREKRLEESAGQYRLLLNQTPEFAAGRLALVKLLDAQGETGDAITQLEIVARSPQAGANVFEELGDMELKSGNRDAARRAYESGEKIADARAAHRLRRKKASAF